MNPDVKTEVISSGPDLTILGLFFQADPFVKGVMFLLIFASIWCWAIIINKYVLLRNERKAYIEFEDIFWSGINLNDLYQEYSENINNSQVRVFISGMREFNKINQRQSLSSAKLKDYFQRINNSMHISINKEIEKLEKGMSFLGSIGSVAPFIGLLGTVWGIVNAFQSIAISNNTSLAVVAPGIAEALFATALGLLAAIPAVAAYNKFSNDLEKLSNNLEYFSIEFSNVLIRQVEEN